MKTHDRDEILNALIYLVNACDKWLPKSYLERLSPEYETAVQVVINAHYDAEDQQTDRQ